MWCFRTQPFFRLNIKRDRSKCDRLELESIEQRLNDLECVLKNVQIYSSDGFNISELQKWHRKRLKSCQSVTSNRKTKVTRQDSECKKEKDTSALSNSKTSCEGELDEKSGQKKKNEPCTTNESNSCGSGSSCESGSGRASGSSCDESGGDGEREREAKEKRYEQHLETEEKHEKKFREFEERHRDIEEKHNEKFIEQEEKHKDKFREQEEKHEEKFREIEEKHIEEEEKHEEKFREKEEKIRENEEKMREKEEKMRAKQEKIREKEEKMREKKRAKMEKEAERKRQAEMMRDARKVKKPDCMKEKKLEAFHIKEVDSDLSDYDTSADSVLVPYESRTKCKHFGEGSMHDKVIQIPSSKAFLQDVSSQVDSKYILISSDSDSSYESDKDSDCSQLAKEPHVTEIETISRGDATEIKHEIDEKPIQEKCAVNDNSKSKASNDNKINTQKRSILNKNNEQSKTLLRTRSNFNNRTKKETKSKLSCPNVHVYKVDALRVLKKLWSKQVVLSSKNSLLDDINLDSNNVVNRYKNDSSLEKSVNNTNSTSDSNEYCTRYTAVCPLCRKRNENISRTLLKALADSLDLSRSPIRIRINDNDSSVSFLMRKGDNKSIQTSLYGVEKARSKDEAYFKRGYNNIHANLFRKSGISNDTSSTPQSLLNESNIAYELLGTSSANEDISTSNTHNVNFISENSCQSRFYENELPRDPSYTPFAHFKRKIFENRLENLTSVSDKNKSTYSHENSNSFMVHVLGPLMVPLNIWKNQASSLSSKIFVKKNRSKHVEKTRKYYTGSNNRNRVRSHIIIDKRKLSSSWRGTESGFSAINSDALSSLHDSKETMNLADSPKDSHRDRITRGTIDDRLEHKRETSQSEDWDLRRTTEQSVSLKSENISKVKLSNCKTVLVHCSNCNKSFIAHFDQMEINIR